MAEFNKQDVIETGKNLIKILIDICNTETKNSLSLQTYMDTSSSENSAYALQQNVMESFSNATSDMGKTAENILVKLDANRERMTKMQEDFSGFVKNVERIQKTRYETDKNIELVNEKINVINSSVSSVEDVAQLTNILSFNASIEAAHAGEAGKGFRVISNEVKKLSDNTTNLSHEISTHVSELKNLIGKIIVENEDKNKVIDQLQTLSLASTETMGVIKESMVENAHFTQSLVNSIDMSRQEIVASTEKVKEGNLDQIRKIAENATSQTIQINDKISFLLQLKSVLEWLEKN